MLGIVFQMDKVYKREEGHCEDDDEADPTWAQEAAAVIRSDQWHNFLKHNLFKDFDSSTTLQSMANEYQTQS